MDQTLRDLGELLIKAIPTIVFFTFLTFYLNAVFFKPIAKILAERNRQTEGVRGLAQQAMEAADAKNAEFERALDLARAELYQENEALRRKWTEEQAQQVAAAREVAHTKLEQARQEIARESRQAQVELDKQVEHLTEQIVNAVMPRRAA